MRIIKRAQKTLKRFCWPSGATSWLVSLSYYCIWCFFFLASQSRAYFLRLAYARDSDLTYSSIRFDKSLQIFESLNIFWSQIQRKRSKDYNLFSYDFGCKKKALSDILASRFIWKYIANTRKPVENINLQGFKFISICLPDSKLIFVNENCCLCTCFTELYLFYWLLVVSFAVLIAAPVVFSRTYNKTSHAGELKMPRVNN